MPCGSILGAWVPGCLGAWVPWSLCCFVALLLGCLVAWVLGCFVALLLCRFVASLLCCLVALLLAHRIWTPCGSLVDSFFVTFGYLLGTFWRLDALGDLFWIPERLLGHVGPGVQKGAKRVTSWPHFGRPWGPQFETILVKLTIF